MKKKLCLTIALACLALTACQPTPEEETVHQKGVENEQKWMEPAPAEDGEKGLDVPAHWEEKLDIREDLKVEMEADIIVPPPRSFPSAHGSL